MMGELLACFAITSSDCGEGFGNPSCPELGVRHLCSVPGSKWIATEYALAMTICKDRSDRMLLPHDGVML